MACSTTVCGILCFDKEWCRSTLPCYIPSQQLLGSACELPPSQTPVPTIPHLSTTAVLRSVLGIWRDCLRNPWRRQQEPTPHWAADGSGSTIWTDKLANSPFARFRVSDSCLWDKYQATEMLRSEEALWCAPNSTALASEKTREKLFVPAPRGTTHRGIPRKATRTTSSSGTVLKWRRPILTLEEPGLSHVRIRSPLWPLPRSNFLSIDPLFDLPRTCEHLPASHPIHLAAVFSGKLPQTLDVSLMSKPRATDVRRHSWSHKKKSTLKQKPTELSNSQSKARACSFRRNPFCTRL